MKRQCAWCGKKLPGEGQEVTHSICPRCFAAALQAQFDFVDQLETAGPGRSQMQRIRTTGSTAHALPSQACFEFEMDGADASR